MLTLEAIQKEWPNLEFQITENDIGDKILHMSFRIEVKTSFMGCENMDLKTFKSRIIEPCLNSMEHKFNKVKSNA